jgi:hypothetical protein
VSGIPEAGLVDACAELVLVDLDAGDARRAPTVSCEAGDRLPLALRIPWARKLNQGEAMGNARAAGLAAVALCGGCAVDAAEPARADVSAESVDWGSQEAEPIGEAEMEISGDACAFICSASAVLACIRMGQICATAAMITLGRSVLPCGTVQIAICATAAGFGAVCNRNCPR